MINKNEIRAGAGQSCMYEAVTNSIKVAVEPFYLENESDPSRRHYFWAYRVTIENLGERAAQLRERFWKITDANGRIEEVRGAGVVGEQPILLPGESFVYTSGCPLTTPSGIMMGTYTMITEDGDEFHAEIPAFSLDLPDISPSIN